MILAQVLVVLAQFLALGARAFGIAALHVLAQFPAVFTALLTVLTDIAAVLTNVLVVLTHVAGLRVNRRDGGKSKNAK